MARYLVALGMLIVLVGPALAGPRGRSSTEAKKTEDSPLVKRTKQRLERKISVNFKDDMLKDVLEELGELAGVKFRRDPTIPGHKRMNYTAENQTVREILDKMFKPDGLGYIIHRAEKPNDRYEGWIFVVMGDQRGDPEAPKKPTATKKHSKKTKPKTTKKKLFGRDLKERQARSKLKYAKFFIEEKEYKTARDYLEQILKRFPETEAAKEAKELLKQLKK